LAAEQAKIRLDNLAVARGLFPSRARARDAILRGAVRVNGAAELKPGRPVAANAEITAADAGQAYVSRAALKLIAALDGFHISAAGAVAADIGASTGGFSQVLLERGAVRVVAVDVGHGQLAAGLRADPRLRLYEGLNARALTAAQFSENGLFTPPNLIVSDVSFISLKLALPPVLALAAKGAKAALLVKPQFEAGREHIGKGGLVAAEIAAAVAQDLYDWLNAQPQWRACGLLPSPIKGGDGNREFLLGGEKSNG